MKNPPAAPAVDLASHSAPGTRRPALRLLAALLLAALPPARAQESAPPAVPPVGQSLGDGAGPAAGLSLDDAVKLALANNRSIKVDTYSKAIARANLLAAYGGFDPTINFNRSHSEAYSLSLQSVQNTIIPISTQVWQDDYSLTLNGTTPWGAVWSLGGTSTNQRGSYNGFASNFLTTGGLTVTQPLLRGFGFAGSGATLGVRIAKANRAISDWAFRQTVIDTVTQVVVAYSNLLAAHENLRAARRVRDGAAQLVSENEKRFKVGSVSENDVTSARAQAALYDQGVLQADEGVREADNQLRQLLGEDRFGNDGPLLAVAAPPVPDLVADPAKDLQTAFELRPDYQQAKLGLSQDRYNESYARNQLLPQVNFVGSYGYTGLDQSFAVSRQMVRDGDNRAYSAGVEVSIPLTFTQGRGKARAARLQRQKDEAQLKLLEENIALGVATAAGEMDTARRSVAAAQNAEKLNESLVEAELKRLRAGTGSTFAVLYQQQQLSTADRQYAAALANQWAAIANYERTLGTTLQDYHITLTQP
ncbi:MAG TPA: TolC family protein [Opitutaceae bacterium]|nr:TolC family protein [Opitutaceae bacterium]